MEDYTDDDRPDVFEAAADHLMGHFFWADTEEGHEFYDGVRDVLNVASLRTAMSDWPAEDNLYDYDPHDLYWEAAEALYDAFNWEGSPEGFTFWSEVQDILEDLAFGVLPNHLEEQPDLFDDQLEPYSESDQPDLPETVEAYFAALDAAAEEYPDEATVEGAVLEAKETFQAYMDETGYEPDVMVLEVEVPGGTLVVEATRIA